MAYDTEKLKKKAIEAIKEHRLFFIEDVVAYLPCDRSTFYNHELHELDTIKELLEKNRIEVKVSMRSKWYKSDNPTLQMGLMKLLATETERRRLAMEYREHSGNVSLFEALTEEHEPDNKNQ